MLHVTERAERPVRSRARVEAVKVRCGGTVLLKWTKQTTVGGDTKHRMQVGRKGVASAVDVGGGGMVCEATGIAALAKRNPHRSPPSACTAHARARRLRKKSRE